MIRQSAFAGSWYPDDPVILRRLIERSKETKKVPPARFALLPHAGLSYSAMGIAPFFGDFDQSVTRLLIVGPSHYAHVPVDRIITVPFASYETPLGSLEGFALHGAKAAHAPTLQREHSIEMILPFIAELKSPPKVSTALINHFSSLKTLDEASDSLIGQDEGLSIIASSDFTHYGPRFGFSALSEKEVKERDVRVAHLLADGKIEEAFSFFTGNHHTICGWASALLAANIAKRKGMNGEGVSYYTSNDVAGRDGGDFVAYATVLWR